MRGRQKERGASSSVYYSSLTREAKCVVRSHDLLHALLSGHGDPEHELGSSRLKDPEHELGSSRHGDPEHELGSSRSGHGDPEHELGSSRLKGQNVTKTLRYFILVPRLKPAWFPSPTRAFERTTPKHKYLQSIQ